MNRYYRNCTVGLSLIAILLLTLMGCQATPPTARLISTQTQSLTEPQAAQIENQFNTSEALPTVDLVDFGANPLSTANIHIQQVTTFAPGDQLARIKVRQIGQLGTAYPTVVGILQNGNFIIGWSGSGSYDILWDGKDATGNFVPNGIYDVILYNNGNYRTSGLNIKNEPKLFLLNPNWKPMAKALAVTKRDDGTRIRIRAFLPLGQSFPDSFLLLYEIAGPSPDPFGFLSPANKSPIGFGRILSKDQPVEPGLYTVVFPGFSIGSLPFKVEKNQTRTVKLLIARYSVGTFRKLGGVASVVVN